MDRPSCAPDVPAVAVVADVSRGPQPRDDRDWVAALRRAIVDGVGVRSHFQPVYDLRHGTPAGFEALARFEGGPSRSPLDWLQAAERHGVRIELEACMLRAGLAGRSLLPDNCFLTVNISPQALDTPLVQKVLADAGDLSRIVVELTEHEAVADYAVLGRHLVELRSRGALIAVDDAGAGYASLQHVRRVAPEFVKLDRDLVDGLGSDPVRLAIVEALGTFAGRVDAWVIAEGIETQEDLDALASLGIPLAQGFGLARPSAHMGGDAPSLQPSAGSLRHTSAADSSIATVLELPPTVCSDGAGGLGAGATGMSTSRPTVVVDVDHRPLALLIPGQSEPVVAPMRVEPTERPHDIARRAMVRPEALRFSPLLVCGKQGQLIGIVRLDRLINLLSNTIEDHGRRDAQS